MKMFYQRDRFKFVFIGAGSTVFTLRLIGDILEEETIRGGTLALVDIDKELLAEVAAGVTALVEHCGGDFSIETHDHYSGAMKDADFVFMTFAVGAYATWKKDIEICSRYGVNQSVGDTIGPGGMIRILRSIPLTLEIAKAMETECPHAYIINYTNPEGAQCLAIQKYSKIRCFGLCHGTPDTAQELAKKVFGVTPERFGFVAAGVNHLTWFTQMCVDGVDVYPQLAEKLSESGMDAGEPVSAALYRIFGLYPAPGDRHVEEFFSTFLRDDVMCEMDLKWKNNSFREVDSWRAEDRKKLERMIRQKDGFDTFLQGSGETATHFIRSLSTGEISTEMVNVPNRGYIGNLSDDIIVELPAFVDQFGIHPQRIGDLPAAIAAKCESLGREYLLLVEAAVEHDARKVIQAAYLDPLCANCDRPEELIRELIRENRHLLPADFS